MSKLKLSLTAVSAALGLAIALQSSPSMAQSVPADALKGSQFDSYEYIRHSWGLEYRPFDAPSIRYSWAEIRASLAQLNATTPVAAVDARPVSADALKGSEFDSPEYVRHSWGLEKVSYDAVPVRFTWGDVNARLNATAKAKPAASQARIQPISPNALRGTQFDSPEFVRHDWGLEYVSADGPLVRLTWGEIKQRLDEVAGSSSADRAG